MLLRPPRREMEGERRAPVLRHHHHLADAERVEEGVEIADMVEEAVVDVGLARLAEADQVRRDAAAERRDMRDDVAPDVGRGRIAVQEQHGRAVRARLDIGHGRIEHGDSSRRNAVKPAFGLSVFKLIGSAPLQRLC